MTTTAGGSTTLFGEMLDLLEREGLAFERHDDERAVRIDYEGSDAEWSCIAQAWEDDRVFAFYSVSPLRATPASAAATAEFVNLVNIGVLVGNFELDASDGEVRFKTSVGFGPSASWSDDLARVVIYTNLAAMDHYALGLLRVVTGASTPGEAIEEIARAEDGDDSATPSTV